MWPGLAQQRGQAYLRSGLVAMIKLNISTAMATPSPRSLASRMIALPVARDNTNEVTVCVHV
jgi:hypothetical protein